MSRAGNGRSKKSIWAHETVLTPERRAWRAVLEQAYEDAELTLCADGTEPLERTLATRFLRADSRSEEADLKLVCDFADVPCDRLILWARRHYPRAEQGTRQEQKVS